jgi:hypothetical protein
MERHALREISNKPLNSNIMKTGVKICFVALSLSSFYACDSLFNRSTKTDNPSELTTTTGISASKDSLGTSSTSGVDANASSQQIESK